jgi:predicted acylesterase/phospholipase RssA
MSAQVQPAPQYDLVFEGGGAKGMVFAGALEVLFEHGFSRPGRLLGTSAGAIVAACLAAGYTPDEMLAALAEKDETTQRSVMEAFLGEPAPFSDAEIQDSEIRNLLAILNLHTVPDRLENWFDGLLADRLLKSRHLRSYASLVERGCWCSADAFVAWMERRLNTGNAFGKNRQFGGLTLQQFREATSVEMTLIAADTTWGRMLLLNHITAPLCPVVYATRMSMSIPLLWPEVHWQAAWGPYKTWNPQTNGLDDNDLTGHSIVDGGMLSNFPIALFLSNEPNIRAVMGQPRADGVLGLLIDDAQQVPNRPAASAAGRPSGFGDLRTTQRLMRLLNTAIGAHDNLAIALHADRIVRLPAGGYGTVQFDMTDAERDALVEAGRLAMRTFLTGRSGQPAGSAAPGDLGPEGLGPSAGLPDLSVSEADRAVANKAAPIILQR